MAEIRPFRAWRYNESLGANIDELTSPLFDVVSEKYRDILYKNEYNSIHISVPLEGPDGELLDRRIEEWKNKGIIVQDRTPAIYVYYQYFKLAGDSKEYCRKGFICNIRLYDWDEEVVLRHEDTMPHSVSDRKQLLEHTQLHVSPTHGLYTDTERSLDHYLDDAILSPIYDCEDYQGVRDVLGVIHDYKIIREFMQLLQDRQVILADGHHRYQGALAYQKEQQEKNAEHDGSEPYNFHTMYLTNTESDDLRIFPTHRLLRKIKGLKTDQFLEDLSAYFHIRSMDNEEDIAEVISGKKWAFGLMMGDEVYKIRLKQEKYYDIDWDIPEVLKRLDITVLHYFVMEKVLGIKKEKQPSSKKIRFERSMSACIKKVLSGKVQAAIITQEIPMQTVKEVCYTGFTLPQKSTYFYPKVICGYLFGSIKPEDNNAKIDLSF
ncbi:MAG: DUF1015 domain-containing protein [Reichenbachiella sp.]|uniref:DUF1015 domain-containing protein n=1 Tax=Reichenbachiella sp. TaxID=2184521 RepID=UPI003264CBE4